jgi:L-serine dehydratase
MEFISVFDIFKIGVGPSSSHTLGPWKAARQFMQYCDEHSEYLLGAKITVSLYGSLSLTGKGHATDLAITMGLAGYDPELVNTDKIPAILEEIKISKKILYKNGNIVIFNPETDIIFEKDFLPFHANGMIFVLERKNGEIYSEVYYSIGGGFIIKEGEVPGDAFAHGSYPYPIENGNQLIKYCKKEDKKISEIVLINELIDRDEHEIRSRLLKIWDTMLESMYHGCHTEGHLPGSINVKRRAAGVTKKLLDISTYSNKEEWFDAIRAKDVNFQDLLKWVGSFAIGVNEINAAFGRVVTAPTNGSAGVIPAVLLYYLCFVDKKAGDDQIIEFLLTAGEIGSIFKKGSTISAAMGGCQAEIGVSSAMAAAGLTELMGGTPEQCTIAAEVAMEHHLGMTCDPIAGLVQVPCIERNSMGAIKAINAASIAIDRDPADIKVPLDNVIKTMWETAQDMNRKYKETSEGGLATAVNIIDC